MALHEINVAFGSLKAGDCIVCAFNARLGGGNQNRMTASKFSNQFFCSQLAKFLILLFVSSKRKLESADFYFERFAEMPHNLIAFLQETAGDAASAFNLAELGR